eukprot:scaffold42272_cov25-Prasinocladus_malaysianus.AAC.5
MSKLYNHEYQLIKPVQASYYEYHLAGFPLTLTPTRWGQFRVPHQRDPSSVALCCCLELSKLEQLLGLKFKLSKYCLARTAGQALSSVARCRQSNTSPHLVVCRG